MLIYGLSFNCDWSSFFKHRERMLSLFFSFTLMYCTLTQDVIIFFILAQNQLGVLYCIVCVYSVLSDQQTSATWIFPTRDTFKRQISQIFHLHSWRIFISSSTANKFTSLGRSRAQDETQTSLVVCSVFQV